MTTAMHGRADTSAQGPSQGDQVIDLSTPPAPSQADAPVDLDALARMAAEVAVSVERHREELAAAMAELTALQRTLRSEVRSVIAELDRIAEGVAPAAVSTTPQGTDALDPAASAASPRSFRGRLRRAH